MTDHHHHRRRTKTNKTPAVASVPLHLGAGLLISAGVVLSSLSSTAIAQTATDADPDTKVLPAMKITAERDTAPLKVEPSAAVHSVVASRSIRRSPRMRYPARKART